MPNAIARTAALRKPGDAAALRRTRWSLTPAGQEALEEAILAEQRRSELRVLDEQLEGA